MSEHFYIMNASCLFDNKAATINETIEQWDNETIIVAKRESGYDKYSRIFISGSQGDYGVKAGDHAYYTQDTGMGYTNVTKV